MGLRTFLLGRHYPLGLSHFTWRPRFKFSVAHFAGDEFIAVQRLVRMDHLRYDKVLLFDMCQAVLDVGAGTFTALVKSMRISPSLVALLSLGASFIEMHGSNSMELAQARQVAEDLRDALHESNECLVAAKSDTCILRSELEEAIRNAQAATTGAHHTIDGRRDAVTAAATFKHQLAGQSSYIHHLEALESDAAVQLKGTKEILRMREAELSTHHDALGHKREELAVVTSHAPQYSASLAELAVHG